MWPENIITEEKIITPANLLEEYGRELGEKTKGIVKGVVRRVELSNEQIFMYKFLLFAEKIKYSFELINITHDISLYPLYLTTDNEIQQETGFHTSIFALKGFSGMAIKADDEEFFKSILKSIFFSKRASRIINSIYAQS